MITRSKFGQDLDPVIQELFVTSMKNHEWQYDKIFNIKETKRDHEIYGGMSGVPQFSKVPELGEIPFKDPVQWYPVNFVPDKFASGLVVSQEMIDDEQHDAIKQEVSNLTTQAYRFVEIAAANIFNLAFSTAVVGGDGLNLISTKHIREDGQATFSNTFVANTATQLPLEENDTNGALATAITLFAKQTDEFGQPIASIPDTLIVPVDLARVAWSLTKNTVKPGATNPQINTFNTNIPNVGTPMNVIVWPYLTSATAWFLLDSKMHTLTFLWRKKPNLYGPDYIATNQSHIWTCDMRFATGWINPRYIFGSKGDGTTYTG